MYDLPMSSVVIQFTASKCRNRCQCDQVMHLCSEIFHDLSLSRYLWLHPYRITAITNSTGIVQVHEHVTRACSLLSLFTLVMPIMDMKQFVFMDLTKGRASIALDVIDTYTTSRFTLMIDDGMCVLVRSFLTRYPSTL